MTVSGQALTGDERSQFKKILKQAKGQKRAALDKKLGKIIQEAIDESGSAALKGTIANKIREQILP